MVVPFPRSVPILLDGKPVPIITAFLFDQGGHDDPMPLLENAGKSFLGSKIYGQGFLFDDSDDKATPIAEMHRIIAENPKNQEIIFPYIGGSEINTSPTHQYHRYVIDCSKNFVEFTLEDVQQYPEIYKILEEKVKPERQKLNNNPEGLRRKKYWWRWGRYTPALFKAIAGCDRVLACSLHSEYFALAILRSQCVFSHGLAVFADSSFSCFAIIQSSVHEYWSRSFGSSLETRFRYTPTDCFETFPFPEEWESDEELERVGRRYYDRRAALMVANDEGLTATYNRFHDPGESDRAIAELRELHREMDRAVLRAYGWDDLEPDCGFGLDYFDGDRAALPVAYREHPLWFGDAADAVRFDAIARSGKRKLPWRYRWAAGDRDAVLARLIALNRDRHTAESLHSKTARSRHPKAIAANQGTLFDAGT